MGLFVGWRRQRNDEALLFRRYNDHVFALAGARWDQPGPVHQLLSDSMALETLASSLTEAMRSRHTFSFLGPCRFLRSRSLFSLAEPWGWKDPRNTYLLRLWLRIFPGARVIHLLRHGVDVAASLRTRHEDRIRSHGATAARAPGSLMDPPNPAISPRCAELAGGFSLWKEYLAEAREGLDALEGEGSRLQLRYEELLSEPESVLARAASFSNLPPDPGALREAVGLVSPDPGERWRRDEELRSFAQEIGEELAAEGYQS
jgi:hypothetical protein